MGSAAAPAAVLRAPASNIFPRAFATGRREQHARRVCSPSANIKRTRRAAPLMSIPTCRETKRPVEVHCPLVWPDSTAQSGVRFFRRFRGRFRIGEPYQLGRAANQIHADDGTHQPENQNDDCGRTISYKRPQDVHNAQHPNDPKRQRELLFCLHCADLSVRCSGDHLIAAETEVCGPTWQGEVVLQPSPFWLRVNAIPGPQGIIQKNPS